MYWFRKEKPGMSKKTRDILILALAAAVLLDIVLAVVLLWAFGSNRLILTAVHPQLASSRGIATKRNETLFTVAIAIVVVVEILLFGQNNGQT